MLKAKFEDARWGVTFIHEVYNDIFIFHSDTALADKNEVGGKELQMRLRDLNRRCM